MWTLRDREGTEDADIESDIVVDLPLTDSGLDSEGDPD
jgi:hypothetical protein